MKLIANLFCSIAVLISVNCQAQKMADSTIVSYMIESVKSIKTFTKKDIFYTNHGKITYKGKKYTVYTFGFNPVVHEPYLYILFYDCPLCDNVILGKSDFLSDLIELNRFYINSNNFKKEKYIELFQDLNNDYHPGKGGYIIDRKDFKK